MIRIPYISQMRHVIPRSVAPLFQEKSGATIIETAVVLPIYCLLYFGICQFAIFLFSYCNATYTCRTIARYASLHSASSLSPATTSQLQSMVTARLFIKSSIVPTVTVSYTDSSLNSATNAIGNYVWVQAGWTQTLPIPYAPKINYPIFTSDLRLITR